MVKRSRSQSTDEPHAPDLLRDAAAGALLPLPHAVDELLAAEVLQGDALRQQLSLHHHLRGDLGVVRAGLPQRAPAAHALVADQRIHQRVLKGVADVQPVGDVGRRDGDAVGRAVAARRKRAATLPLGVEVALDGAGVVSVGSTHGGSRLARHVCPYSQSSSS